MKIETKYNTGDQVYQLFNGKAHRIEIMRIRIDAMNDSYVVTYYCQMGGKKFKIDEDDLIESDRDRQSE